jgi:ribosomal protein L11 methyltransferase
MPWLRLIIETEPQTAEQLSELLSELGAAAVTMEDDADQPLYEPAVGETPLWNRTRVVALLEADHPIPELIAALEQALAPAPLPPWRTEPLEDKDWSRAWMDDFKPMRFGQRLWIVPTWCEPQAPDAVNIELDPGLAFGTGTHPTTRLCLQWLDTHPPAGGRVIDYGCGSGILAIAAAKLGAEQVVGVDNDPQALIATRENAERNGVADVLSTYSPEQVPEEPAELVLANILAGPLISLAPRLALLTRSGGSLVVSGILANQAETVATAYRQWYTMAEPVQEEDWVRLEGVRH